MKCDSCGTDWPEHLLDGKPRWLRRRLLTSIMPVGLVRWFINRALNDGSDFDWFECPRCYGPGYDVGDDPGLSEKLQREMRYFREHTHPHWMTTIESSPGVDPGPRRTFPLFPEAFAAAAAPIIITDPPYLPMPRIGKLKPNPDRERSQNVLTAIYHLRAARDLLIEAECPRTLERVRGALKSADGARRHVEALEDRAAQ